MEAALVEERERIASELRSGPVRSLFWVTLKLQSLATSTWDTATIKGLATCIDELDQAILELREQVLGGTIEHGRPEGTRGRQLHDSSTRARQESERLRQAATELVSRSREQRRRRRHGGSEAGPG